MANFIKVPLKDTTPAGGSLSGSNEHIRLYTTLAAEQDQVQVPIIEYFANGSACSCNSSNSTGY
jgi:hypothetical protein